MKILSILLCSSFFYCSQGISGEVDPFLALNEEITDATEPVEKYLNTLVTDILERYNNSPPINTQCNDVALHVMEKLGATDYLVTTIGALNSPLELWVESNSDIDRIPRYGYSEETYNHNSIYSPGLKFFGVWSTNIDPTIIINGVYLGTEKLSHFLGSGYEYYKRYLKAQQHGDPAWLAELSVIKWGIKMENSIIGTWSVGIFSYADLEANYQGFLMARDLCGNALLRQKDNTWSLAHTIQLQNYINPDWDEAYNPNGYTKKRKEDIQQNIAQLEVCQKVHNITYSKRLSTYRQWTQLHQGKTNLSRSLFALFQTEDSSKREDFFTTFRQQYKIPWSYDRLKQYFEPLIEADTPTSIEMLCLVYESSQLQHSPSK